MIKGVNLGGWLVLEKWMSPQIFEGVEAEDEYYLPRDLDEQEYKTRIETHRANFITEADFIRIKSMGLNSIRIPVPYFIFGDVHPFIGAIDYLDKAFNWAEYYDLTILLDLHTVPGSQNGFDNGGITGVINWAKNPEAVDFTISVLNRLAERYGKREGLYGIELLNEPVTEIMYADMQRRYTARDSKLSEHNAPITFKFLYEFYIRAYEELRKILPLDKVIMFHDGFDISKWENFFKLNKFENVVLDTHHYLMTAETSNENLSLDLYEKYIEKLGNQIAKVNEFVPVIVGEWSLFNSLATGTETKGGINPTQETFEKTKTISQEEIIKIYRKMWDIQIEQWNKVQGYFFWSYKMNIDTVNEPVWLGWDAWSLERSTNKNWAEI